VEKILMRLANIPDLPPVGTVITATPATIQGVATSTEPGESLRSIQKSYPEIFGNLSELDMWALRHLLREAWDSSGPRREWFAFLLRQFHAEITRRLQAVHEDGGKKLVSDSHIKKTQLEEFLSSKNPAQMLYNLRDSELADQAFHAEVPAPTRFEESFLHLQRNLRRALYCDNPECQAPRFFRKKKGQKFCSPECRIWSDRLNKRTWWQEHRGKESKRRR
jgi:hypothetical protein